MSDLYAEHLVKKSATPKDTIIKCLLIGGVILAVLMGIFIHPFGYPVAIAIAVAAYFLIPSLDLEYEYLYVNGELDIDKIMSRIKRKRVKSFDTKNMEIMAPVKSHKLDYYNSNTRIKVLDYSSGDSAKKIYAMIIPDAKDLCKVLIEPDARILEDMKRNSPRKVFDD